MHSSRPYLTQPWTQPTAAAGTRSDEARGRVRAPLARTAAFARRAAHRDPRVGREAVQARPAARGGRRRGGRVVDPREAGEGDACQGEEG